MDYYKSSYQIKLNLKIKKCLMFGQENGRQRQKYNIDIELEFAEYPINLTVIEIYAYR